LNLEKWKIGVLALAFCLCLGVHMKTEAASKVKGIDVSVNNGIVDWESVKNQGYTYAMIKTGDGQAPEDFYSDVDAQFESNYEGAGAVGLKRGVYHVCCTRTVEGAIAEAEYCLKILNGRKLEYPVAYDMEMPGNFAGGKSNTTAMAKAFCDRIRKAGYTPMIYSSSSHLSKDFKWSRLKNVKVWVAHYGVKKPSYSGIYHMWQYTNSAEVSGAGNVQGETDVNYSYLEKPRQVTLKKKRITLKKGKTYKIKATVSPATVYDKLKYASNRKKVASVNAKGVVRAKKKGSAVITIKTVNGKRAKLTVKVK
jgi:lysozyme